MKIDALAVRLDDEPLLFWRAAVGTYGKRDGVLFSFYGSFVDRPRDFKLARILFQSADIESSLRLRLQQDSIRVRSSEVTTVQWNRIVCEGRIRLFQQNPKGDFPR